MENDTLVEGLPIRQWAKAPIRINNNLLREPDKAIEDDGEWPELPMPKDSHLYEPYTQHLLRIARRGRNVRLNPQPVEEDKLLGDEEDAEREVDPESVFSNWQRIPQHLDQPIPEYLAPRRKGLPPLYGGNTLIGDNPAPMRKTKLRKADTEGNETILEVLVPEGQAVDGEVVEDEAQPTESLKPGTVVDGVGIVNAEGVVVAGEQAQATPPRRRPPPPKRKAKGLGRGRRKKVMFGRNAHMAEGAGQATNGVTDGEGLATPGGTADASAQDHDMNGDSLLHDGEEGSEEEDEGDEGDSDREDGELSPSPAPSLKSPKPEGQPLEVAKQSDPLGSGKMELDGHEDPASSPLSSPDVPLAEQNLNQGTGQSSVDQKDQEPSTQQDGMIQTNELEQNRYEDEGHKKGHQHGQEPEQGQHQGQENEEERDHQHDQREQHERQAVHHMAEPQKEKLDDEMLDTPEQSELTQLVDPITTELTKPQTVDTNVITVEELTAPESVPVQAQIPEDTNLLDGLTEPKAPDAATETHRQDSHDGEEDLLGSLERTLEAPS